EQLLLRSDIRRIRRVVDDALSGRWRMQGDVRHWVLWIWAGLGLLWLVTALAAKRTTRLADPVSMITDLTVISLGFAFLFNPRLGVFAHGRFIPDAPAVAAIGLVLTLAGAMLASWARLQLGSNWSGVVALKSDHELIQGGPYAWVRHPLYSGMLAA